LGLQLQDLLKTLEQQRQHSVRNDLVREAIWRRAANACEYCLLPINSRFHVEHIIPPNRWPDYIQGHLRDVQPIPGRRGLHHLNNLAWSCAFCNGAKGPQITYPLGQQQVRLFDPRYDSWPDHFVFMHHYLFIAGTTTIGRATVAAMGLNAAQLDGPLGPRHDAIVLGSYPPQWARSWIIP